MKNIFCVENFEHLYIHIPFCDQKCSYCDFNTYIGKKHWHQRYFIALGNELRLRMQKSARPLQSIYFGGGTPSSVDIKYIEEIISIIKELRPLAEDCEITLEANPLYKDILKLNSYKKMGINRLSVGIQSVDDSVLKLLARNHSVQEAYDYLTEARKLNFDNINLDFILALPGENITYLEDDLTFIQNFQAEHISAYSLILEENTAFWMRFVKLGKDIDLLLSSEQERRHFYFFRDGLKNLGYSHYEISNFAKANYESRHNTAYWRLKNYQAAGAGACRYLSFKRSSSLSSLKMYVEFYEHLDEYKFDLLKQYEKINVDETNLSQREAEAEFFILGFRCLSGVKQEDFENIFGKKWSLRFDLIINSLLKRKLIIYDKGAYFLSIKGEDYANEVFSSFI